MAAMLEIVWSLVALSPRQGRNEVRTRKFLERFLRESGTPFAVETFTTHVPLERTARLLADGRAVPAKSCCFVSGKIHGKDHLISSLIFDADIDIPNINFNPHCDGFSLVSYYEKPALAIRRGDVPKIIRAKRVEGVVTVERYTFESANILVGNTKNPKAVLFAHYDSIQTGAIDNASGVATLLQVITDRPDALTDHLFVFSGNEELSYDGSCYWGYGFRDFERRHRALLERSRAIYAVDSLGYSTPVIDTAEWMAFQAFPIRNLKKWQHKIYTVHGDIDKLMEVYHSDLDTPDRLSERFLREGVQALLRAVERDALPQERPRVRGKRTPS
jgi:hypothetical protein